MHPEPNWSDCESAIRSQSGTLRRYRITAEAIVEELELLWTAPQTNREMNQSNSSDGQPGAAVPTRTLPHDQHFPHIVAGQEEFDGGEVAEQGFDVAVVEDALQAETLVDGGVDGSSWAAAGLAAQHDGLHFECIFPHDVKAVAGGIRAGVFGVEEGEQHASRPQHGPQAAHDRTDQAFVEIVRQVPAQNHVEMRRRVDQVVS